jgi:ribosome biogenesis ATPase
MSRRIVAQFLTCLDELSMEDKETSGTVVVIGATSRPDSIDPSLRYENSTVALRDTRLTGSIVVVGGWTYRRAGRFARELALGIPDEPSRTRILEVLTKGLRLSGNFNFREIAHKTPGYGPTRVFPAVSISESVIAHCADFLPFTQLCRR